MRAALIRWARLVLLLAVIGTVLGSLGALDWRLELFSHFMPFYALITLLGAALLWWKIQRTSQHINLQNGSRRDRRWCWALLGLSAWLGVQMGFAWYSPQLASGTPPVTLPIRAVAFNVLFSNTQYANAERWLLAQNADVLLLTEATPLWQANLAQLQRALPQGCAAWDDSPFGIAVLLKSAPRTCEVLYTDTQYRLYPYIRVELQDHTIVYGIHPPPPLGAELAYSRDHALRLIAQRIAAETTPVIVLGDMNITPYSPIYQQFRLDAGLSEVGFALRPTWSPIHGLPLLPLDRVLIRGVFATAWSATQRIGPALGSDHRPIVLEVRAHR